MSPSALVVGASGIVGNNLATHLRERGLASAWTGAAAANRHRWRDAGRSRPAGSGFASFGLARPASRRPSSSPPGCGRRQRQKTSGSIARWCAICSMRCRHAGSVKHVALVTGLKHYLGPFEAYGKGTLPATPFREEQPRLDIENFYYAQEDEVFAAAKRDGFGWSVHRPHTIIGYALGNAMNMGVTLAVYATICRETGRPFLFPGSRAQWNGLTDMTDARLLARHLEWAATTRLHAIRPSTSSTATSSAGAGCGRGWPTGSGSMPRRIPGKARSAGAATGRRRAALGRNRTQARTRWSRTSTALASAWHTDADLGRPIEVVTDMSKSRKLGFLDYQPTDDSFFDLFARLREAKIIP